MSSFFSANQYESGFKPKHLVNWEKPAIHKSRPVRMHGHTRIIADDHGALTEDNLRCQNNPWGNYVGTWDMPKKIAGNQVLDPTSRATHAQQKLSEEFTAANRVLSGVLKNESRAARRKLVHQAPAQLNITNAATTAKSCTPTPGDAARAPAAGPVEEMLEVPQAGRSPTPPTRSPRPANDAVIDEETQTLEASAAQ